MIKRLVAILLLGVMVGSSYAREVAHANFTYLYDLDATAITYCKVLGAGGSPFNGPKPGDGTVTSTSTTLDFTTADATSNMGTNDIILTNVDNVVQKLIVLSVTDGNTVVVRTAPSPALTAAQFSWYDTECGTAATSGWISLEELEPGSHVTLAIIQANVTGGIDVRGECRGAYLGATANQVFPACTTGACGTVQNYAGTVGITSTTTIAELTMACEEFRVGLLINTADDGGDTGANAEQITIGLSGVVDAR